MADSDSTQSPTWSPTTKLLVGLTVVAFITALVIYFRSIIGPLLLAFILAYSLHPIVARIDRGTKLGWRGSVAVVYFVLVVILLALLTLLGFAFVQQVQSLLSILNFITENLPQQVEQLSHQIILIGPFQLNLSQFDLGTLANQLLSVLQPTLVRMGTLVSGFAAGTLVTLGWGLFVLVISYFLLAEAGRVRNDLIQLDIPGYNTDVQRLSLAFRRIWQVFLRGQLGIFFLAILL